MLRKFGLADASTVSTPADCNVKLVKDDHVSKSTDQAEYKSMVGSLLYITMGTCPDIALSPGPTLRGRKGLVSTACACANRTIKPW